MREQTQNVIIKRIQETESFEQEKLTVTKINGLANVPRVVYVAEDKVPEADGLIVFEKINRSTDVETLVETGAIPENDILQFLRDFLVTHQKICLTSVHIFFFEGLIIWNKYDFFF